MSLQFQAIVEPSAELIDTIAEITPDNPFYTNQYLAVRRSLGATPFAIFVSSDGDPIAGCVGFQTKGRLNSRFEITSLPVVPDPILFWQGLFGFCRDEGISLLSTHTFGSIETSIPERRGRIGHKVRSEYRLDLHQPDLWAQMNRRSRRQVKTARDAGMMIQRSNDDATLTRHFGLANLSLDRRSSQGDEIDYRIEMAEISAFLEFGAGEIFQAVLDGEVMSSLLVARSRTGAYSQSSGTTDLGRDLGSSHFLFHEAAKILKAEGVEVFNLGGADDSSVGLQQFKLGLGSIRVDLDSAEFFTGGPFKRIFTRVIGLIHS